MRPTPRPAERPPARAAGFTLVELLLAVAIAVLVAALAWSLLSTTTRSVETQLERARGPAAAGAAIDRIEADLAAAFSPEDDENCALALQPAGEEPFALTFCAIRAAGRTPDLLWTEPRRVEYRLAAGTGDEPGALLRLEQALSGPLETVTNVLLDRVTAFAVTLSDGVDWYTAWPPPDTAGARPRAARVALRVGGEEPVEAEFWLPIGHTATSRLIRASQPPPE